ncbi:hypothetical protein TREES_T100004014 [Tupaia chinensis]|uniref:Uncharacterized protein n=1 Tax=Tupaia chinensis TaxID=246437 RepID=L9KNS6_TUPCH|nr:hypothetical protein TREES_T100004014 [Tupaia chinensis]
MDGQRVFLFNDGPRGASLGRTRPSAKTLPCLGMSLLLVARGCKALDGTGAIHNGLDTGLPDVKRWPPLRSLYRLPSARDPQQHGPHGIQVCNALTAIQRRRQQPGSLVQGASSFRTAAARDPASLGDWQGSGHRFPCFSISAVASVIRFGSEENCPRRQLRLDLAVDALMPKRQKRRTTKPNSEHADADPRSCP